MLLCCPSHSGKSWNFLSRIGPLFSKACLPYVEVVSRLKPVLVCSWLRRGYAATQLCIKSPPSLLLVDFVVPDAVYPLHLRLRSARSLFRHHRTRLLTVIWITAPVNISHGPETHTHHSNPTGTDPIIPSIKSQLSTFLRSSHTEGPSASHSIRPKGNPKLSLFESTRTPHWSPSCHQIVAQLRRAPVTAPAREQNAQVTAWVKTAAKQVDASQPKTSTFVVSLQRPHPSAMPSGVKAMSVSKPSRLA